MSFEDKLQGVAQWYRQLHFHSSDEEALKSIQQALESLPMWQEAFALHPKYEGTPAQELSYICFMCQMVQHRWKESGRSKKISLHDYIMEEGDSESLSIMSRARLLGLSLEAMIDRLYEVVQEIPVNLGRHTAEDVLEDDSDTMTLTELLADEEEEPEGKWSIDDLLSSKTRFGLVRLAYKVREKRPGFAVRLMHIAMPLPRGSGNPRWQDEEGRFDQSRYNREHQREYLQRIRDTEPEKHQRRRIYERIYALRKKDPELFAELMARWKAGESIDFEAYGLRPMAPFKRRKFTPEELQKKKEEDLAWEQRDKEKGLGEYKRFRQKFDKKMDELRARGVRFMGEELPQEGTPVYNELWLKALLKHYKPSESIPTWSHSGWG